ncbi:MAG: hypothetical protein PHX86_06195 [Caldisericia bacterium]|nr:hypothetical protein [Caldisericia bacterium]
MKIIERRLIPVKKQLLSVLIVLIALCLVSVGCKDITGSFKPGSFGKTTREKAMIEAIKEKYGDITQKGDPRFLEARMTSQIEDFIPVDTVSKYSKDSAKLFAWFVYDNFNNDTLEIEWIYIEDDYSIHTFQSQTGDDFGRGAFILERPDDGWALGKYKVIIRGRGLSVTLPFEIHDGPTVSEPLPFENGKFTLAPKPGWYYTHWEYVQNPNDTSIVGGKQGRFANGELYYEYTEGKGDKNNFTTKCWRTFANGNIIASGSATSTWTDPPTFFGENDQPSFTINRATESSWGINKMNVSWDMADIKPGGATAGAVAFQSSDGKTYFDNFSGVVQLKKTGLKGSKKGDKKAIIVNLGNIYGYKYYYEWRE